MTFTKTPIIVKNYFKKRPTLQNRRHNHYENDPECFQRAIGPILLLAQFFGILPIYNIRGNGFKKLSFKALGPRVIYSYILLLGISFMTSISIIHFILTMDASSFQKRDGISYAASGAIFYGSSLLGNYLFLRLCPGWITLQYDWRTMEKVLDKNIKRKCPRLRWRFSIIACTMSSLALIEHVLSMVINTPYEYLDGSHSLEQFFEAYAKTSHRFITQYVNYNLTLGVFIFVFSKISTFTWNFTDLFIILVSIGISENYRSLNDYVIETPPGRLTNAHWRKLRECYTVLSTLVKKVDNKISGIIFLSFTGNIYFICLNVLNKFKPPEVEKPLIYSIYNGGSFLLLLGRAISVTLLAARINDQSKVIMPILYNCPSVDYCVEAERLQVQMSGDDVALTGLNFFSITRNFILSVVGVIITYEVILLQFMSLGNRC